MSKSHCLLWLNGITHHNIPWSLIFFTAVHTTFSLGDRGRKVTYTEHDENEFDENTATPTRRRGGPTDAVCTPVGTSDNAPRNSIRMSSVKSKNGEIHTPNRLDEYSSESDGNESDDDDTSDFEWDDESVDSDSGVNPIGPGPAPDDVSVDEDDIEEDAALVFDEDGQVDEDATNFCNDEEEEEEEESTSKRKRGGSKSTSKGKGKGKGKRKKKPKLPYKEALELYNKEKAEHIEKGTMFVVQTGKTKIAKGVRVETKKAPRRKGTVIADRKKVQGRWKWEVQFDDDDGNTECFAPQSLKLLANVVEYTWKTVEDHVPTAAPSNDDLPDFIRRKGDDDYETIGVQGFNFNLFRNENVDLIIDMHNQARQGILRLEELWRTIDPYQKLFETILGITVVDCWKGVKHAMRRNSDNIHHGMGIVDFADRIAWDCLNVPASFFDEAINVGDVEGDIGNSVSRPASASTGPRCDPHLPFLPEGWQTMDEKTLFKETKKLHKSKKTDKKGSDNKALRRACQAKGRGCKNTENRQNRECNNPGCAAVERTMNRNTTIGVFLCKRKNCRNAHVADIIKTHCNRDVGHLVKNNSDSDSDSD